MLGTYFYHEILRKTVIAFGTLFINFHIRHKGSGGANFSVMKVPLAYGPIQKFLARIEQRPQLNKELAITLPRISFEMTGIQYDPARKTSVTQTFVAAGDNQKARKVYMPVPYNIQFELNIITNLNDDSLQIVEQILPYFQPAFSVTINLVSAIGEKKDIPITLDSISQRDEYEGDYSQRTLIIHTLAFSAKTYLFGPVADSTAGLIKKIDVDYYQDTQVKTAKRVQRYTATPAALKDYDDDNAAVVDGGITTEVTKIKLSSTTAISKGDRIIIDDEIMYVKSKTATTLTVNRGYDGTTIAEHLHEASVDILNAADDALVEFGDDFGFNETTSFFTDSKNYSPSQGIDI